MNLVTTLLSTITESTYALERLGQLPPTQAAEVAEDLLLEVSLAAGRCLRAGKIDGQPALINGILASAVEAQGVMKELGKSRPKPLQIYTLYLIWRRLSLLAAVALGDGPEGGQWNATTS